MYHKLHYMLAYFLPYSLRSNCLLKDHWFFVALQNVSHFQTVFSTTD